MVCARLGSQPQAEQFCLLPVAFAFPAERVTQHASFFSAEEAKIVKLLTDNDQVL